ncbi:MAG TPA: response regulator, partial [Clostridia bacterium]|nr:response regulator [Clostridia bacterium]
MYKLLIVEDEKWEREGLRDFLQWNSMGIEVVGCACNGAEGKEMAATYHPHIIITDIKMPILDGIQMSRDIRSFLPETHIIILSGHDDFDYARQAFDFQAFAYLLKPIQKKPLEETIVNVLEKLKDEKACQKERVALESQWVEFTQKNLDYLLVDFMKHKAEMEYIDELPPLKMLKVYKKKVVAIFSLSLDGSKSIARYGLKDDTMGKVLKAFHTMLGMRGFAVSCNELPDEVIVCMDASSTKKELQNDLMRMVEELRQKLGISCIVGIGESIDDLESIPMSYTQACKALSFRFIANYDELLFYNTIKDFDQKDSDLAGKLVERIDFISRKTVNHIQKGDINWSVRNMDDFLAILREDLSESRILLNRFIMNVVNGLNITLSPNTENDVYVALYNQEKCTVDYSMLDSLLQTKKYVIDFLNRITENIKKDSCEDNVVRIV